jgi:hypothetical protein
LERLVDLEVLLSLSGEAPIRYLDKAQTPVLVARLVSAQVQLAAWVLAFQRSALSPVTQMLRSLVECLALVVHWALQSLQHKHSVSWLAQ